MSHQQSAAAGLFDFDHVGAEVAHEHGGVRSGGGVTEIEDADSVQREADVSLGCHAYCCAVSECCNTASGVVSCVRLMTLTRSPNCGCEASLSFGCHASPR
jgi:hypothetical protein